MVWWKIDDDDVLFVGVCLCVCDVMLCEIVRCVIKCGGV